MFKHLIFGIVLVLSSLQALPQSPSTNVFFIGHSLCSIDMPKMLSDLAADGGHNYSYDYQLIWGACLSKQWDNHLSPDVGSDSWAELNSGDYDALIMMEGVPLIEVVSGPGWGCDYRTENVAGWFYDRAKSGNPGIKGFLIEPWNEFNRDSPTYYQEWLDTGAVQEPLFQEVVDDIAFDYPNYDPVCIIPLRQCLEALVDSIWQGKVPGLSHMFDIYDLAADTVPEHTFHVNSLGHYFNALVHYTAIFGVSPVGLTHETYELDGFPYPVPSPAMALKMQEIVWEVYSGYAGCSGITGVEELGEVDLRIYPNPTNGRVVIAWTGTVSRIQVINQLGQIVYADNTPDQRLAGQSSFDLSHLDTGMYWVRLETKTGSEVRKVLLQK